MGVFELFSKRQRRVRGEVPDVYVYDSLPRELPVQVIHIVQDAFGVDNYGTNNAAKAYELVQCKVRGWATQPNDTAKALITVCFTNSFLPAYVDSKFSSLCSLLESGELTVCNKNGGHGQGADPIAVPGYLARYALNLTATSVLFLTEAHSSRTK